MNEHSNLNFKTKQQSTEPQDNPEGSNGSVSSLRRASCSEIPEKSRANDNPAPEQG